MCYLVGRKVQITLIFYSVGNPILIIGRNDTPPLKKKKKKSSCVSLRLTFESFHGLLKMILKMIFICSVIFACLSFIVFYFMIHNCLVMGFFWFSLVFLQLMYPEKKEKTFSCFLRISVCSVCNDIKNGVAA